MNGCPVDDVSLELYVGGALSGAESARVEAHLLSCALCAEEVAWLRAERRLFQARADALPPPPAFSDVMARVAQGARVPEEIGRPHAVRKGFRSVILRGAFPLGLCAAASLLGFFLRENAEPPPISVSPEPARALVEPPPDLAGEDPERIRNCELSCAELAESQCGDCGSQNAKSPGREPADKANASSDVSDVNEANASQSLEDVCSTPESEPINL